jgi:hypothetical protein
MDELRTIREVLDGEPPSESSTSRARNRLILEIQAPTRSPQRSSRRWSLAAATAMAGAMVIIAAFVLVRSPADQVRPAPSGAADVSPHDILLAAAQRAATGAETGRYWHVRSLSLGGPIRVGIPPNQYYLLRRAVTELWFSRDPADRSWNGHRALGYQPRAAADEQAWRAAGSPKRWTLPSAGEPLVDAPGEASLEPDDSSATYLPDIGGVGLAQVRQLPTDPARLRALFEERIARDGLPPGSENSGIRLFGVMTQLLVTVPAPAQVRAAALMVLASVPGMHSIGEVTDAQGRTGVGVELRRSGGDISEVHRLVIDPTTHLILARDYVAQHGAQPVKESHVVVLVSEWTDRQPEPPAIP